MRLLEQISETHCFFYLGKETDQGDRKEDFHEVGNRESSTSQITPKPYLEMDSKLYTIVQNS